VSVRRGHRRVGASLADLLAERGVRLLLADTDPTVSVPPRPALTGTSSRPQ